MKTVVMRQTSFLSKPVIPLPNVITRRQFFRKVLDSVLIFAGSVGIAVMVLFFLMLA